MPASPLLPIDEQAADWLIRLNEADISADERLQFEHWKRQDPRHAAAAERLHGFVSRLQALRDQQAPVQAALGAAYVERRRSRRHLGSAALLCLLLALPIGLWLRGYPLADLRTEAGHWQRQRLEDGSKLTLGGNSAVDLQFDAGQRQIKLLRGEILVEVAHDADRPFTVVTEDGSMRALGTRFMVKREAHGTLLVMLESRVRAQGAARSTGTEVKAGEQVRIFPDAVNLLGNIDSAGQEAAWQQRQLVVQDRPLPEVLDELARQLPGHVQFDRQDLASLRVTAVLPLDNPQRALQLIADALPLRVRSLTGWWVQVERTAPVEN